MNLVLSGVVLVIIGLIWIIGAVVFYDKIVKSPSTIKTIPEKSEEEKANAVNNAMAMGNLRTELNSVEEPKIEEPKKSVPLEASSPNPAIATQSTNSSNDDDDNDIEEEEEDLKQNASLSVGYERDIEEQNDAAVEVDLEAAANMESPEQAFNKPEEKDNNNQTVQASPLVPLDSNNQEEGEDWDYEGMIGELEYDELTTDVDNSLIQNVEEVPEMEMDDSELLELVHQEEGIESELELEEEVEKDESENINDDDSENLNPDKYMDLDV